MFQTSILRTDWPPFLYTLSSSHFRNINDTFLFSRSLTLDGPLKFRGENYTSVKKNKKKLRRILIISIGDYLCDDSRKETTFGHEEALLF